MCGIAGVLDADPAESDRATRAMIGAITHRGPDGVRVEHAHGAAFAHARLSIIDLEGGWQPMHAAGGTVIGNGEIYNYRELARDYQLAGKLSTGSDFEPLLHIYAQEGPAAFDKLRGMYALCLIGADGRTWLARDPFGIKPLYLLEHAGGLAFASEPRSFLASGLLDAELDEDAGRELLAFNYVLGEKTIFRGLRRLAPGEVVEVKDGRIVEARRRPPLPTVRPSRSEEEALLRDLDAVLEDSVSVHQRSDVPYGLFLSGGIDSAAIATLMARLNSRPVTAFTCGFDAPGARDERRQAERIARALDLDWRETTFGEEDFWRILPQVAWALDDPTADYATLPTYKLAEAAKHDLTVVLTGEGGDELFGGYGRYRRALRPTWLGGRPAEPRTDDPGVLARWRQAAAAPRELSNLQKSQWADVATWLPNDLLLKLDRCLMAHGLEGRTPFLDPEVAAFAWALPDRMKVQGRFGKWILRKWLERACPAAEPWARKQGFTVPVEAWIAPRARDVGERISRLDAVRRVRDPNAVKASFAADDGGQRWPLLFYAVWSLIHLEGAAPKDALAHVAGSI
ncbi:asparagine synthase (glutamine-hydrolyzing) [Phenylobacterium deserti]|uniref:asparagine synthase (glutamine-hydrolyzing) n=1 Tax=Phenylobacterium deserti TaxID=1914756 RepID=A0A328ASP2_9CAUL|nr:asparagine synthase (glutamine-hydrolyzing) [Phenylobacterium deserti]RAK58102.1 asparagine synthase (glutamine-hydrolyzing) [Phenylobacterium deserti]